MEAQHAVVEAQHRAVEACRAESSRTQKKSHRTATSHRHRKSCPYVALPAVERGGRVVGINSYNNTVIVHIILYGMTRHMIGFHGVLECDARVCRHMCSHGGYHDTHACKRQKYLSKFNQQRSADTVRVCGNHLARVLKMARARVYVCVSCSMSCMFVVCVFVAVVYSQRVGSMTRGIGRGRV